MMPFRRYLFTQLRSLGLPLMLFWVALILLAEVLIYYKSHVLESESEFMRSKVETAGTQFSTKIALAQLHTDSLLSGSLKGIPKIINQLKLELEVLADDNPYLHGLVTYDGTRPEIWIGSIPELNPRFDTGSTMIYVDGNYYLREARESERQRAIVAYYRMNHSKLKSMLGVLKDRHSLPFDFSRSKASSDFKSNVLLTNGSTVGILSVPENIAEILKTELNEKADFVRNAYFFVGLILLIFFIYRLAQGLKAHYAFILKVLLVLLSWPLVQNMAMEFEQQQISDLFAIPLSIFSSLIYTIYISFLCFLVSREILQRKRLYGISWYPRTIAFSLFSGIISALFLFSTMDQMMALASKLEFSLFDLSIYPSFSTMLFFLNVGISLAAALILCFLLLYFILGTEVDQITWVSPLSSLGFGITTWLYTRQLDGAYDIYLVQTIVFVVVFFVLLNLAQVYLKHQKDLRRFSPIRSIAAFVTIVVVISSPFLLKTGNIQVQNILKAQTTLIADEVISDKPGINDKRYFNQLLNSPNERIYSTVYDERGRILRVYNRGLIQNEEYNVLPPAIITAFSSTSFNEFSTEEGTFIEHLLKKDKYYLRSIVKKPGIHIYLFSVFRYLFVFLLSVGLSIVVLRLIQGQGLQSFQSNEKLQSRITDSYLFATLIFLMILVGVTQLIVQNEGESEIISGLEQELDLAIERLNVQQRNWRDAVRLSNMQSPVFVYRDMKASVDVNLGMYASFLKNAQWLDYEIYSELVLRGKLRHFHSYDVDGKTIIVGYHNAGRNSAGQAIILALPNFVNPNYVNPRLLETLSYLIVIYLFFFGVFIIGASFIAKYLIQPLLNLLDGLKRISSGQFDTMLPVNTQDEIGDLANTYNLMVYKLKDLQKELSEVERQAAWSEMARQVAHEIKNPLTPMKLSIQHLNRQVNDGGRNFNELKPIINNITTSLIEQIESLANIASDFSKFARPLSDKFSVLDLNVICQSMSSLYEHDKRVLLILDTDSEPLFIQGVADELKRVLINLIKNSSEAMPNGGIIMLRSYRHRNNAFVEVVDNGIGIPEAEKVKIFTPNFSTKTSGTGLGLAICKKLVEAHKGEISFASVIGAGTTFTLQFPLSEPS